MRIERRYCGSPKTAVFFTGNRDQREDDRTYEWTQTAETLKVNAIFIIDDDFRWYHTCIDDVKEFLEDEVIGEKYMIGASSGGYAALLFGWMLGCPSLSFGPQTILSYDERHRYKPEWMHKIGKAIDETRHKNYLDLSFIKGNQHHIHYCSKYEHDTYFAERMDVTKVKHKCDKHNVGAYLKAEKIIHLIVEEFINGKEGRT